MVKTLLFIEIYSYDQARSQDLEKGGGAILKEWEVCKRPWPELSLLLNQFHTVCTKIETKFFGSLVNLMVFPLKTRWSPKKKRKVFTDFETDFLAEISISKLFFAQTSKRLRGAFFLWGGAIFNFSSKIDFKTTKKVRFCILHKPMGGARAPPAPPGYATGYDVVENISSVSNSYWLRV